MAIFSLLTKLFELASATPLKGCLNLRVFRAQYMYVNVQLNTRKIGFLYFNEKLCHF